MERSDELAYMGITKDTPEKDAINYGSCHKGRNCESCSAYCNMGSGFLIDTDVPKIAKHLGISEAKLKMNYLEPVRMYNKTMWRPKLIKKNDLPYGKCVFFNEQEKCTIHGVKPMQCKTSVCNEYGEQLTEWFMLNHVIDANDPHAIREWAQRLKVKKTIHGGELHQLVKDQELLKKILTFEKINK